MNIALVEMQIHSEADTHCASSKIFSSGLTGVAAVHFMETFLRSDVLVYMAGGKLTVFVSKCLH